MATKKRDAAAASREIAEAIAEASSGVRRVRWHRVMLEAGRPVLSGKTAMEPRAGVWVAALESRDGGQTTLEAVAVDGIHVYRRWCHCGQDRAGVWHRAGLALIKLKGGH